MYVKKGLTLKSALFNNSHFPFLQLRVDPKHDVVQSSGLYQEVFLTSLLNRRWYSASHSVCFIPAEKNQHVPTCWLESTVGLRTDFRIVEERRIWTRITPGFLCRPDLRLVCTARAIPYPSYRYRSSAN